jgi:hypothetical protein
MIATDNINRNGKALGELYKGRLFLEVVKICSNILIVRALAELNGKMRIIKECKNSSNLFPAIILGIAL